MNDVRKTLRLLIGDGINIILCLFVLYVTLLAVMQFDALEHSYISNALLLLCITIMYLTYKVIRNRHEIEKMKDKLSAMQEVTSGQCHANNNDNK